MERIQECFAASPGSGQDFLHLCRNILMLPPGCLGVPCLSEEENKARIAPVGSEADRGQKALECVPRFVVAAGDVALVLIGFYLAFLVRFGAELPPDNWRPFLHLAPWLAGGALLVFMGLGLYDRRLDGFAPTMRGLLTAVVLIGLGAAVASYWSREFAFPRSVILIGGCIQLILLVGWRRLIWRLDIRLHGRRGLLIVGDDGEALSFWGKLWGMPGGLFWIVGVLPPEQTDQLEERLAEADAVVVMPSLSAEVRRQVAAASLERGREVYLVPSDFEVMVNSARVSQIDDLPVLQLERFQLSWSQAVAKRLMDVSAALAGLTVGLPVLICLVFLIAVTSPGSPFYVQERVGRHGRVFWLYKLRTMVADAEEDTGPVLAAVGDPRVTGLGRFLRAARLDELPQLFNVLKGDMSIVGPRPERAEFVQQFEAENAAYQYRQLVKPGLTGLAQVQGRYDTSAADKLRFDLYYVRNYSLLMDLQIMLQTIPVVLTPSAALGQNGRPVPKSVAFLTNSRTESEQALGEKRAPN